MTGQSALSRRRSNRSARPRLARWRNLLPVRQCRDDWPTAQVRRCRGHGGRVRRLGADRGRSGGRRLPGRVGDREHGHQYTIWNVDGAGNYTTHAAGLVTGSSSAIQCWRPPSARPQPQRADRHRPRRPIESSGSTRLAQVADTYFLYAGAGKTGPPAQFGGAGVTVGEFGAGRRSRPKRLAAAIRSCGRSSARTSYTIWNVRRCRQLHDTRRRSCDGQQFGGGVAGDQLQPGSQS